MRKTLIVAEMVARDLLRRRGALALLALVPLAFYLARHDDKVGQSIRFATLGLSWTVSTLALFSGTAAKGAEPRLRIGGYRPGQLYAGRLVALLGIGLALGAAYWALIVVDQDLQRPGALAVLIAVSVVVAAPMGLLIGAVVPRDLEFLMDPAKSAARLLPLWSNREIGTYTVDLTDAGYLQRGLLHAALCTLLLVGVTAALTSVRLRRRRHVRFSSAA
jgi:hypothetical protein